MADFFTVITDEQAFLIRSAPLFFVGSADPSLSATPHGPGPVNVSPKGAVPLHILDRNRVACVDYTGSGNETARHSLAGGPVTVMVCAFERDNAAVVRLYGKATVTPLEESPFADVLLESPATEIRLPQRQAIVIQVERTATSCGYGVLVMTFEAQRTIADRGRRYKAMKKAGMTALNP